VQLNFSLQNKFIIVLPWGHQVDNDTFSKVCIFKGHTVYIDDGGYETKSVCFNYNKIKGNEELIMVVLIKIMDGLCRNLYFSACRKYVYKTQL
jgi:hypothetical protein